ncbi:MAG: WG repeat-containing protein, partial [Clostridia bacterium]
MRNSNQFHNQEDVRKTVRNNGAKKKNNNNSKVIKIILLIAIIVIAIIIINNVRNNKAIALQEVTEYNYFTTSINGKAGVIDKTGKTIIEPQYDYIQIPNPSKPVFICLFDYNTETSEYNSKVLNEKGKEILTQYEKVQAIPNNNTSISNNYQTSILRYKENNKYGLISLDGKRITKAIYDNIETLEYKDGILKIKKDNQYGLIDINGEEVVPAEYNSILADGYYEQNTKYDNAGYIVNIKTDEGYRYGYINSKGKQILDTIYTNIKRITEIKTNETVYLTTYKNGKVGIIKNGQTIIENEYENIEYDSTTQLLAIQKNAKQGVYDLSGNMVLPIQYDEINFAGKYINANKDNKLLVFDAAGILQNDDSYKSLIPVEGGKYNITIDRANNYGVIDNNNIVVIENKYSYIEYAFDDYFIVSQNGKSGIVDTKSNVVIPIEKNVVHHINGTKIIQTINSENNTSEIYNEKMEKVSSNVNSRIYIRDNYIEVLTSNNVEYFDFNGNKKDAKDIFENNIFAKEENGKWGYVDKNGNTVIDFKYEMTTNINKYGFG